MIKYHKGSLFDAPKNSILVHACNTQGVWGSGIAAEFHRLFPISFQYYKTVCEFKQYHDKNFKVSNMVITPKEENYHVGCLLTSNGYGATRDSKLQILTNTDGALYEFLDLYIDHYKGLEIHSCKFNSGLFGVPWEETEAVLLEVLKEYSEIIWNVWEL